ncbi:MAG: nuclear transport factor 2 family protein [Pelomonas sp.]|nr:nuclear transport factor 2 family protein [Roseateles sp.]
MRTPLATAQAQLDAYNARNMLALLSCYAEDAELYGVGGELLAKGHDQLRARFQMRFGEPDLHARLLSRMVVGRVVVDSESITRNFPEGLGTVEYLGVYEIEGGVIRRATVAFGEKFVGCKAG